MSTGRCLEYGEQRGTLATSPQTKTENNRKDTPIFTDNTVCILGRVGGKVKWQPEFTQCLRAAGGGEGNRRERRKESDRGGRKCVQGQGGLCHLTLLKTMHVNHSAHLAGTQVAIVNYNKIPERMYKGIVQHGPNPALPRDCI